MPSTQEKLSIDRHHYNHHKWTFGERLADKIAIFGGSWKFLISFSIFLLIWITANSLIYLWKPADPYPFIFLNLLLSCLSSVQAPVIMMSQNRKEEKDRLTAQEDYLINLKAEQEIRNLHEKLDQFITHHTEHVKKIHATQLALLDQLRERTD